MPWVYLYVAIALEVAGTTSLKLSRGFEELLPSVLAMGFYGLSLVSLNMALKTLPVGMAYAIWSGLGTMAVATIGILYFREPPSVAKLVCLALIIVGVVGLNLTGARH
ncbi:MAG: multidrug efflux SMR transporter [Polyangiales bacterium]